MFHSHPSHILKPSKTRAVENRTQAAQNIDHWLEVTPIGRLGWLKSSMPPQADQCLPNLTWETQGTRILGQKAPKTPSTKNSTQIAHHCYGDLGKCIEYTSCARYGKRPTLSHRCKRMYSTTCMKRAGAEEHWIVPPSVKTIWHATPAAARDHSSTPTA